MSTALVDIKNTIDMSLRRPAHVGKNRTLSSERLPCPLASWSCGSGW